MTVKIIIAIVIGILAGHFTNIDFSVLSVDIVDILIYAILLTTGLSIGYGGNIRQNIKKSGVDIIFIPLILIIGGIIGGAISALILKENILDMIIAASPLGWYTFGGGAVGKYDFKLGTIAFLAGMMREFFGITMAEVVAKRFGYLETIAIGGAPSAFTCLGSISKATDSHTAITAFMNGMILTVLVPFLVQFLLVMKFGA